MLRNTKCELYPEVEESRLTAAAGSRATHVFKSEQELLDLPTAQFYSLKWQNRGDQRQ
jgi:hypothetical protein